MECPVCLSQSLKLIGDLNVCESCHAKFRNDTEMVMCQRKYLGLTVKEASSFTGLKPTYYHKKEISPDKLFMQRVRGLVEVFNRGRMGA